MARSPRLDCYVFNFEFPHNAESILAGPYELTRLDDYPERLRQLSHRVSVFSEFEVKATSGGVGCTGKVHGPAREPACLPWRASDKTGLHDIEVLLRLFSGRDVFFYPHKEFEDGVVPVVDPREHWWGGALRASVPYVQGSGPVYEAPNIGFEQEVTRVYDLLRDRQWAAQWDQGRFLLLALQAFRQWDLEPAFILSWSLWEYLFALMTSGWLRAEVIRTTRAHDKIAYVLAHGGLLPSLDSRHHGFIESMVATRNEVVHRGTFLSAENASRGEMFIRLTELLLTELLRLPRKDIFNVMDRLADTTKS